MTLYLDPRLGSGDLYGLLPRGETELLQLSDSEGRGIGDAMASGWGPAGPIIWGAEIKQLSDALASLQDGRLPASQLPRMHDYYDYVFLVIEWDVRVDPQTGNLQRRVRKQQKNKRWHEFWADVLYGASKRVLAVDFLEWLLSLHVCGGARLLSSSGREMTASWLVALHRLFGKDWSKHKSLKVFDESHPPRFVIPSRAAKGIERLADGLGWEKSMVAAEHFGTIQNAANATMEEWMQVSGIGKELAGRAFAGAREPHRMVVKRGTAFGQNGAGACRQKTLSSKSAKSSMRRSARRPDGAKKN
jgi:ERCC4-type nuclease